MTALRRAFRFLRLIHSARPDAVLLFGSSGLSFIEKGVYAAYARLLGIPSLLSIRSGHFIDLCRRSIPFTWVARLLLAAPALLPCQGKRWQRFFEEELSIPANRCPVLDSWVASEPLLAIGRHRLARSTRPVRLLFMGWLERFKGIYDLLEAVIILRKRHGVPAFEVLFAGDGGERSYAETFVKHHHLQDSVRLLGWVEGDSKHALFASSEIFVLPSHTEGLPNAMIEAMATGLPVVVTPVGSIPDVIENSRNGLLVPPADPNALADALHALIADPQERTRLGAAAYREAVTRFSVERAAEHFDALITRAVEKRPH